MSVVTVAVEGELISALEPFGDIRETVNQAMRHYALGKIADKIAALRAEDRAWQEKYGCSYEEFVRRMASDRDFHAYVEQHINKDWEGDLVHWEFCHKGVNDWLRRLEQILTG